MGFWQRAGLKNLPLDLNKNPLIASGYFFLYSVARLEILILI